MPPESHLQAIAPEGVATLAPYSPAIAAGGLVFVSGQLAMDQHGQVVGDEIEAQTRQTFANVRAVLQAAGCDLKDVVSVTNYLVHPDDFAGFNAVYETLFTRPYPARVTVLANLLAPGARLETSAIAVRPA